MTKITNEKTIEKKRQSEKFLKREKIAKKALRLLKTIKHPGLNYVNLGLGIPTLLPFYNN